MTKETLYYDGACPLCAREMKHLAKLKRESLDLVDIHGLEITEEMPSKEDLLLNLHLKRGEEWVVGADANVAAWQHTRFGALGHQTSGRHRREQSEFAECGFEALWQARVNAPFVAESPLNIGLKLSEHHPLQINGTQLLIGSVETLEFNESAYREDGTLDLHALDLVAAVGLDAYHSVDAGQRYTYAKPDHSPKAL